MSILLDTQLFLWFLAESRRLTQDARRRVQDADQVFVSAATIWEVAVKIGLRKLDWRIADIVAGIGGSGFAELPVLAAHACRVVDLPMHHRDPFDRMLIAQARVERISLVTADALLGRYGDPVVVV